MKPYSKRPEDDFYYSMAWRKTRAAYIKLHPFCERCLSVGVYEIATDVHHKERINMTNIRDTNISLDFGNLVALCDACHHEEHRQKKRYVADENGHVEIR